MCTVSTILPICNPHCVLTYSAYITPMYCNVAAATVTERQLLGWIVQLHECTSVGCCFWL